MSSKYEDIFNLSHALSVVSSEITNLQTKDAFAMMGTDLREKFLRRLLKVYMNIIDDLQFHTQGSNPT